ncbi:hypothetical protein HYW59_00160 [Candidatus Kaiserbacteria bacterium]|nr:hypothetical protein [Candidatus Kaiserbacteria bacterium]
MKKALLAATLVAVLAFASLAHGQFGDFIFPGVGGGGAGSTPSAPDQPTQSKSNTNVGKAILICIAAADVSEFVEVGRHGDGSADPRDLTMLESQRAAERGCIAFALLRPLYRWPDNWATYQVARWAHAFRKTSQGQMLFALCRRGPAADGCESGMARFAEEMVYAYHHGELRTGFVAEMHKLGFTIRIVNLGESPRKKKKRGG